MSITVNTLVDENDGIGAGGISLRDAIAAAVAGETIDFSPSLTSGGPGTIVLSHGEMLVNKSMTIVGPGANLLTIDAHQASRIFNISDGSSGTVIDVEIVGMTLIGGRGTSHGGGITSSENLKITNCTLSGNWPVGGGGAVLSDGGRLTVTGSTITANLANFGGGIWQFAGFLTVENSTISSNNTGGSGAGIYIERGGEATIRNSTISGNTANSNGGGGIYARGSKVTVEDSTISGNMAKNFGNGGGILASTGYFFGGTYRSSPVILTRTTITGNSATGRGGGIVAGSDLTVSSSTFSGNTAAFDGGGIFAARTSTVSSSTISGNSATDGGGISFLGTFAFDNSTVSDNSAKESGGGLYSSPGPGSGLVFLIRSTITTNRADSDGNATGTGGGMDAPSFNLDHTIVAGNLRGM